MNTENKEMLNIIIDIFLTDWLNVVFGGSADEQEFSKLVGMENWFFDWRNLLIVSWEKALEKLFKF
jgi:hypothetical protein